MEVKTFWVITNNGSPDKEIPAITANIREIHIGIPRTSVTTIVTSREATISHFTPRRRANSPCLLLHSRKSVVMASNRNNIATTAPAGMAR